MRLADLRTNRQERAALLKAFEAAWVEVGPHHDFGSLELHPQAARVFGLWIDRYVSAMLLGKSDKETTGRLLAEFEERYDTLRREADTEEEQTRISAAALLVMASLRGWRYSAWCLQQPWGDWSGFERQLPAERLWSKWSGERRPTATRTGKVRRTARPHAQTQWLRGVLTDLRVWTVDEIGPQEIERVLRGYPVGVKQERALAVLRDFFDWCEAHGHIDRSPVRKEA